MNCARYALARKNALEVRARRQAPHDAETTFVVADQSSSLSVLLLYHERRYPVPVIWDACEGAQSRELCRTARRIVVWPRLARMLSLHWQRFGMARISRASARAVALAIVLGQHSESI